MGDLSKVLDGVIKAPLWVFLALALAASVPLVPAAGFRAVGLTPDIKVAGLPVAVYALIFWSLFASSAVARSFGVIRLALQSAVSRGAHMKPYRNLSAEARWLLASIEEHGLSQVPIPKGEPAVRELRDAVLLEYVGPYNDAADVGVYKPTFNFQSDLIYHQGELRKFLRAHLGDMSAFNTRIEKAVRGW